MARLKAEAQLRSAELERLREVEKNMKLESERYSADLDRLWEMEGEFVTVSARAAKAEKDNEQQGRQVHELQQQQKLLEEEIDGLRKDRAVMGNIAQSRLTVESKQLAEITTLTRQNEHQERQIQGLLRNQKEVEAAEGKITTLTRENETKKLELQTQAEEQSRLAAEIEEL